MPKVGIFTSICEEDAVWLDQYLRDIERFGFPFSMHFDRCSPETIVKAYSHPLCIGKTEQSDKNIEFTEMQKQGILDLVADYRTDRGEYRFDWALAWDIDETWERNAPEKIRDILVSHKEDDALDVKFATLWDDDEHIRTDVWFNPETGHRVKLLNLRKPVRWEFYSPVINGPRMVSKETGLVLTEFSMPKVDLVCLHHGMKTHELRLQHKERWDRIYGKVSGKNVSDFWKDSLDYEKYPPTVVKHAYN